MKRKIQLSMITVALITAVLATFDYETIYYFVNKNKMPYDSWFELFFLIPVIFIVITLCIVISKCMVPKILKPVEDMVEHIDDATFKPEYQELVPIMDKIRAQHNDILAAANERQDFSASVSHELKTPLTAISGYAELLEMDVSDDSQRVHFAQEIKSNADRLLGLINDIIDLSQLDRIQNVEFEKFDLYTMVDECLETLEMIAQKAKVSLMFSGEHCNIYGNKEQLQEVVYNLVQNAIRYNKENGHVWINIKSEHGGVLSVKDDGIGISKDEQEKVFERFYRVDKSRSKATGGTGLGLSIVKHIVELHKAKLEIISEIGEGTEIKVVF